jgi:hypothetical protein
MKNYARALVAIAFFLGLTGAVKAQGQDGVIVAMPFEFVAGAKTLPAGTYTVRNSSDDRTGTLVISSQDHGTAMFLLPYVSESAVTSKPELSFDRVDGHYFLSTVQTPETTYRIHVPHASANETVVKANDGIPASAAHGGR